MTTTAPTAKCTRCGRGLRSAASVLAGMGRTCQRKARQEAAAKLILANYSAAQVESVKQVLADGGVARVDRHRFEVVSSDGTRRYEVDTTRAACTCKAGENGRRCFHLAAATLAAA